MSRSYPANTQVQKFLEESYNKERDCRLSWYMKTVRSNRDGTGGTGGGKTDSKQFEVFRKKIEAACPKPTAGLLELRAVKPKSYHKKIIRTDDHLIQSTDSSKNASLTVDMRPVGCRVKDRLYDGFTKEGKGRYQYLQNRYQEIPEAKYRFPVLSSWEYGWRLGDVIKVDDIRKPKHGRTRIVADTFYTRTNIPSLRTMSSF